MKGRLQSERGMSLVEATIILMVLAVLTSVVAPSVADYVEDARHTKAKEDVEAIGGGIMRLVRDSGLPCLSSSPAASPCTRANRVDLLIGASGTTPSVAASAYSVGNANTIAVANTIGAGGVASVNWMGATASGADPDTNVEIPSGQRDTIEDQLVTNAADYADLTFTGGGGPKAGLGWRGAYVSGPVGADPWGFIYQANTVFLTPATDAGVGNGEGQRHGGWKSDVMVLSPGGNGIVQTAFGGTTNLGSVAAGDDVIFVVQGATR